MPPWFQPELQGQRIHLRPLVEADFSDLFRVASDPQLWEQHPESNRYQYPIFRSFFDRALESRGALAVFDRSTQEIIGSSRFYEYDAEANTVCIGFTFISRSRWGGKFNGELKQLMLRHAFQYVDSVHFHIGEKNLRSRTAIERLGARYLGAIERKSGSGGPIASVVYEIRREKGGDSVSREPSTRITF